MRRTLKIKLVILAAALLCLLASILDRQYDPPAWAGVLYGTAVGVLLNVLSSWAAE